LWTAVQQDPGDPGGEPCLTAEARQGLPRLQERVLHRVLGVVRIPEHSQRHAVELVLVLAHQGGEGVLVTAPGQLDPAGFQGIGRPVHADRRRGHRPITSCPIRKFAIRCNPSDMPVSK
jgi:hypothetical protein